MKITALFLLLMAVLPAGGSLYDFKIKSLDGKMVDFSSFKGKTLLIVNTASECGYTPQYADLQKLHEQFGSKITILGFPANNFGQQEPGSNEQIKEFCDKTYRISFPVMSKVSVKGDDIAPLFKWLTSEPNPDFTGEIKWNFEKFLLDENGKLIHRFKHRLEPMSEPIINAIENK